MKPLQMFLLAADKLVRCRWDGRSDQLEIVNTALEGETLREVARDSANPQRLYAATLTEIHVSEDGGENWKWLPPVASTFAISGRWRSIRREATKFTSVRCRPPSMSVKTAAARFASCPHSAD